MEHGILSPEAFPNTVRLSALFFTRAYKAPVL
jgi:hypothetical protein